MSKATSFKTAKLPNGAELRFPSTTPDAVVKDTVKRVLGVEAKLDIQDVLDQLSDKITSQDYFSPALAKSTDKQAKTVETSVGKLSSVLSKLTFDKDSSNALKSQTGVFQSFFDFWKKDKVEDRKLTKAGVDQLSDQIVNVTKQMAIITSKMNDNALLLSKAIDANTKAVNSLVEAYRSPKTIIRDENGKAEGIK